jgi:hypothetical protein
MGMGEIHRIAEWRARRAAEGDALMDVPPFALEEPCPGCGERRVATMVWRSAPDAPPVALPRMAPHFLCRDGEVFQEVTDAGIRLSGWTGILGRFEEAASGT